MRNRKHDIEKYLRGELSPPEMHALEKEALSDPFLAEALEGIDHAGADNFLYDLHQINRSVHDRMRRKNRKTSRTIRIWGWTSAVAATILLTAVSGFFVVKILKDQRTPENAVSSASKKKDVDALRSDSLAVDRKDSSLIALQKPQVATEAPADDATPPSAANEARRETSPQKNRSSPGRTDEQRADGAQPLAGNETGQDGDETENVLSSERPLITEQEPSFQDTLSTEVPSGHQASSRALEGKKSGVSTRQEETARPQVPAMPLKMVKGKVTSEEGHGLPGVNVSIEGSATGTVTDAEGNYEINVPDDSRLVFSFIGFESQAVPADESEVDVTLEEDISALSEVVVTGYTPDRAVQDPSSFRFAEPDGGKTDFKSYLANTVKYPQEAIKNKTQGKVTVRFTVEPNGTLTDFEVVKGIGSGCEEELIRAIQKGPDWKPGTRGDQPVKDKVRVKFKFSLPK